MNRNLQDVKYPHLNKDEVVNTALAINRFDYALIFSEFSAPYRDDDG